MEDQEYIDRQKNKLKRWKELQTGQVEEEHPTVLKARRRASSLPSREKPDSRIREKEKADYLSELKRQGRKLTLQQYKDYGKKPTRIKSKYRKTDKKIGSVARKIIKTGLSSVKKIKSQEEKEYLMYLKSQRAKKKAHFDAKKRAYYESRQRAQFEAEQLAMQQDPRFQQVNEISWANSEDMEHQARVQEFRQRQEIQDNFQPQRRGGILKDLSYRFSNGLKKSMINISSASIVATNPRRLYRSSRNMLTPTTNNLMNQPNEMFNNRGRLSLMGSERIPKAKFNRVEKINFINDNLSNKIIRKPNIPLKENKFNGRVKWF